MLPINVSTWNVSLPSGQVTPEASPEAEQPVGQETYPAVAPVPIAHRFATLRRGLFTLLTKSMMDDERTPELLAELDIKCIRMASVCRQLYLKEKE